MTRSVRHIILIAEEIHSYFLNLAMLHVAQTLCLLLLGVHDLELVKANKRLPFHDVLANIY